MDKIIVYLDNAAFAQQQLAPMAVGRAAVPTHWIVVACAPRLTQHASKWVNNTARENWRAKWSEQLFAQVVPMLQQRGDHVTPVVARGRLMALTESLLAQHAGARVLDARRPKLGQDLQPVTPGQPVTDNSPWTVPGAVAGLAAVLVLAAE